MRFSKIAWMVFSLALLMGVQAFAAEAKIGVVDFQRVLRESKGGKAAKSQIEQKGKGVESSLVSKGKALEAEKKKLESEAMVMNADARENKAREFKIKVMDFQALQKKSAEDFKEYEIEIIRKVQKDVFNLVETIGKRDNYTLILEKSAALYNPSGVDITDQVIKMYDKK